MIMSKTGIKNILKNTFSISEYNETHYIIRLFGIKIKMQKPYYAKKKKESVFYTYKKNNIDITRLPAATGQVRDIQLANLEILKEFDRICKENNLQYWLFAGSILGAVRHKGYIPWDDDIDVAMLREDYNRIIDIFNKSTNMDLVAVEFCSSVNNVAYMIKIKHKYCDYLFIDIYATDITGKCLNLEEQVLETKNIKRQRAEIKRNSIKSCDERLKALLKIKDKYIDYSKQNEASDILLGVEWDHAEPNWFMSYDSVFPLKTIEFEGYEFSSMSRPKDYLEAYYGDYMSYPKRITMGHSMYIPLSDKDKEIINQLKKSKE